MKTTSMCIAIVSSVLVPALMVTAGSASAQESKQPSLHTLYPADSSLAANAIIQRAYDAAGGEEWRRPKSLLMHGYAVFYNGHEAIRYEPYTMHRVYASSKQAAHEANGKVRIEAMKDGATAFIIAYDGTTTYNPTGPVEDQAANAQWSESFGFGAIRHALDDGWTQHRLPDEMVDGRACFLVELTDPQGEKTQFAIAQDDYAILAVGFRTHRGWHERRYSNFFSNPGSPWVQPGRVRLLYDGVKQNEVIWTRFELNSDLDDALFQIAPE